MSNQTVTVFREDGSEAEVEILIRFKNEDTDYIITEDPDDPDSAICFRCGSDGELVSIETDEEFEEGCKRYEYAVPFTKESLLYRDIFEKYYPGQAEMVVDFWMPNKEWEGCDVNDPSARVLSNYGDSGK